jgi:ArsR family transcriptional regulator
MFFPDKAAGYAEARRVLRPGGRLLVVDMLPHAREEYRQQMGHVWPGFAEAQLAGWLADAGFARVRWRALPADPQAKGPVLFAASARAA